ncbi:hypothetical protein HID58_036477 [Brassica napus]|uniref:Uncharacterized protein n=1 Tax=Brassica napus TaxID=3708 RepID=A0ABQ8C7U8_BRANA|nr:hypothetical protein HID58_036477 [Brassica napus]
MLSNQEDDGRSKVMGVGREARDQIPSNAPLRFGDATIGDQSRSTKRTCEIETVKPSLQAPLVEHVSTLQLPHLFSLPQLRQTHNAIGTTVFASAPVREETVQAQLIGEDDDVGESRGYDGGGGVVDGEIGIGIAGTVEEGAETTEEDGEEREEHQRDRVGRDVTELTL